MPPAKAPARARTKSPRPKARPSRPVRPSPPKLAPLSPQEIPEAPKGFRVERATPLGRHALLEVFPGLDALGTARRQVPDADARKHLFGETFVEIVADDVWMYVAPWKVPRIPKRFRRRWNPVSTPNLDCIVVGESHLRSSPGLTLYLDIYHELCHVLQRHDGRELFPDGLSYVERTTEIDAYRFVVDEARRFGVPDPVLRDYLLVEWISGEDFLTLLGAVGVPPPP